VDFNVVIAIFPLSTYYYASIVYVIYAAPVLFQYALETPKLGLIEFI
jgi:hypothetical protein